MTRVTEVLFDGDAAPGVALVSFSREEKLNAFGLETWAQLGEALSRLERDSALRVGVLTGRGRAFAAGADIDLYIDASAEDFAAFQRLVRRITDQLVECPKPIIAAVNGYALGGGFELVLACDLVVASAAAKFGLPEGRLGLLPGGGGTQRLPRAVGRRRAKELLMTGEMIDAQEAHRLGVVNRIVEPERLLPAAYELAAEIQKLGPLAVSRAKRVVDQGLDGPLSEGLDLEHAEMTGLFGTRDAKEGIAAFKDKRSPKFTGE